MFRSSRTFIYSNMQIALGRDDIRMPHGLFYFVDVGASGIQPGAKRAPQTVTVTLGPSRKSLRGSNAVDRPDDVLPHIGVGIVKHSLEMWQRIDMRDFAKRSRSFFTEVADIVGQCRGKH